MFFESFLVCAARGAPAHRPETPNGGASGPRAPAVCAVLVLTVAAIALVAVLTALAASTGLDKAAHLGLWF
jgi:hypothetical protein